MQCYAASFLLGESNFVVPAIYLRVTYEAATVAKLEHAFREAVEDYLELCQAENIKPETPFKGSFNVRVGRNLHRQIALEAARRGMSLNSLIIEALEKETHHPV